MILPSDYGGDKMSDDQEYCGFCLCYNPGDGGDSNEAWCRGSGEDVTEGDKACSFYMNATEHDCPESCSNYR